MSTVVARRRTPDRSRSWVDGALTATLALALAAVALVVGGQALGYQVLVERSDSMAPHLRAGDLLANRTVQVTELAVGDVVTFIDPRRDGERLTHRVVSVAPAASDHLDVVTQGDANSGQERWTVPASGQVGVLVAHVPQAGRAVTALNERPVRLGLITVMTVAAAFLLLRRVWS